MFVPEYFDYNATTPLDPAVLAAMQPYLTESYGNASSRHEFGRAARRAIDTAREQVAAAVGAHPTEVIFTSGGSESNNLFLKGVAATHRPGRLAIGATEHPSVRQPAMQLASAGWALDTVAVDGDGQIDPASFAACLARRPVLVSCMLANNETGVVSPIAALAAQARAAGVWFHCDAVQGLGKMAVDFRALGISGLSLSAHKIYGPKGVGALVIDKRVDLQPLIAGGGHERGLRSGTENVAGIVGFGAACELATATLSARCQAAGALLSDLEAGLGALGARFFGQAAERLPNTVFFAFAGIDGETLVGKLDRAGYAVASGAACSSAVAAPSAVLDAMGVAPEIARGAVRISLGARTTAAGVKGLLVAMKETLGALRGLTAVAA